MTQVSTKSRAHRAKDVTRTVANEAKRAKTAPAPKKAKAAKATKAAKAAVAKQPKAAAPVKVQPPVIPGSHGAVDLSVFLPQAPQGLQVVESEDAARHGGHGAPPGHWHPNPMPRPGPRPPRPGPIFPGPRPPRPGPIFPGPRPPHPGPIYPGPYNPYPPYPRPPYYPPVPPYYPPVPPYQPPQPHYWRPPSGYRPINGQPPPPGFYPNGEAYIRGNPNTLNQLLSFCRQPHINVQMYAMQKDGFFDQKYRVFFYGDAYAVRQAEDYANYIG